MAFEFTDVRDKARGTRCWAGEHAGRVQKSRSCVEVENPPHLSDISPLGRLHYYRHGSVHRLQALPRQAEMRETGEGGRSLTNGTSHFLDNI